MENTKKSDTVKYAERLHENKGDRNKLARTLKARRQKVGTKPGVKSVRPERVTAFRREFEQRKVPLVSKKRFSQGDKADPIVMFGTLRLQ